MPGAGFESYNDVVSKVVVDPCAAGGEILCCCCCCWKLWRDWDWEGVLDGLELPSSKKLKSGGSGEPEREGWAELVLLLALRFMPARERLRQRAM